MSETTEGEDTERVWLVERTYSDDEQNLIILTYATPDGSLEYRKERALTSFSGADRETTASLVVDNENLAAVEDDTQSRYAAEATRMRDTHAPTESV